MGAQGAVPGLANVDPHGYVRLYDAATDGRWEAARALQERLCRLFELADVTRGRLGPDAEAYGAFKHALVRRGVIACAATGLPLQPLLPAEAEAVGRALSDAGLG
ncbi:MAG: dihydrodipicolinate synthase family protein [Streptosporangiaceae bacterium]